MTLGGGQTTIEAVLTRTASSGAAGRTDLPFAGPEDALRLLLRQVATTVLPRTLSFRFDTGARIDCEVSDRQIRRVGVFPVDGPPITFAMNAPDAAPLQPADLAEALIGVISGARQVSISSGRPGERSAAAGLSADTLASALGLPALWSAPRPPRETVEDFFARTARVIVCAMHLPGGPHDPICGNAEQLERLAARTTPMLSVDEGPGPLSTLVGRRGVAVLGPTAPECEELVLVAHDGALAAALASAGSGPVLAAAYGEVVRGR